MNGTPLTETKKSSTRPNAKKVTTQNANPKTWSLNGRSPTCGEPFPGSANRVLASRVTNRARAHTPASRPNPSLSPSLSPSSSLDGVARVIPTHRIRRAVVTESCPGRLARARRRASIVDGVGIVGIIITDVIVSLDARRDARRRDAKSRRARKPEH